MSKHYTPSPPKTPTKERSLPNLSPPPTLPPGQWGTTERGKTPKCLLRPSLNHKHHGTSWTAGRLTLLKDGHSKESQVVTQATSPRWLETIPTSMLGGLQFSLGETFPLPTKPAIIVLYAGQNNDSSLESAIHSVAPWYTPHVLAIDLIRGLDMLSDEPYNSLCTACLRGEVAAVIDPTAEPG